MFKGLILGIILGVLLVAAGVYFYFSTGHAPVAVTSPNMPMERALARLALHSYMDKLPHPEPQVPLDEANYLAGTRVYKDNCAVCHGLPSKDKTFIAAGMSPAPPQLFKGDGVTDDEAWETYWKVEGGIRMTGMPGFKGKLTEQQIWQVTILLRDADKVPASVKAALAEAAPPPATTMLPLPLGPAPRKL